MLAVTKGPPDECGLWWLVRGSSLLRITRHRTVQGRTHRCRWHCLLGGVAFSMMALLGHRVVRTHQSCHRALGTDTAVQHAAITADRKRRALKLLGMSTATFLLEGIHNPKPQTYPVATEPLGRP